MSINLAKLNREKEIPGHRIIGNTHNGESWDFDPSWQAETARERLKVSLIK